MYIVCIFVSLWFITDRFTHILQGYLSGFAAKLGSCITKSPLGNNNHNQNKAQHYHVHIMICIVGGWN